jgi:ATP-dependent Clp protease ATP-binding subunit ClpA
VIPGCVWVTGDLSSGSAIDIANLLKPALARDDFRCIGATTTEEFERYVKPDAAFTRRFQIVRLSEPSEAEATEVCLAWARRISEIQRVLIHDAAVAAAVRLSARLIRGRALPDKAIDLLENAAAFVKVSSLSVRGGAPTKQQPEVTEADITSVLEEQYGISTAAADVLDVEAARTVLSGHLVGQGVPVEEIAETLGTLGTGTTTTARPLGVFLFAGPSGVGKTFAAELLARALFGPDPAALARFAMNELKERHELARLIGALREPQGRLPHTRVRRRPGDPVHLDGLRGRRGPQVCAQETRLTSAGRGLRAGGSYCRGSASDPR